MINMFLHNLKLNILYLGIHIKNTNLDGSIWRHNECSILTNSTKRCQQCNLLFPYFRVYRKRLSIRNKTYVSSTLTPTRRSILKQILRKTKMVKQSNKR